MLAVSINVGDFAFEALPEGAFVLRCRSCGGVSRRGGAGEKPGVMLHPVACRTLAGLLDLRAQVPFVIFNLPGHGLVEIRHDVLAS